MKTDDKLTRRQRDLLATVARARRTTLLRWAFYLKLVDGASDLLGHPDLYGHEIEVDRRDVFRLVELGLMRRLATGERGFIDDYDITKQGLSLDRNLSALASLRRTAWLWLPAVFIVNVALAWLIA